MEVGAHTVTHPQLDTLPPGLSRRELREPKAVLEDVLGHEVRASRLSARLQQPGGAQGGSPRGYASAVAVRHALSSETDEAYRIARLILRRTHTVADVEAGWTGGAPGRAVPRLAADDRLAVVPAGPRGRQGPGLRGLGHFHDAECSELWHSG